LRGLSVTIVEQGDLGQGTSGRYHGLLHSGGRYVLSDPISAVDCRRENELLRRLAPHAIEPTGGFFVSTAADSPEFADDWLAACRALELPVEEITPAAALRREPLLTPRIGRVFAVQDASLDSFELLHALARGVGEAGGTILLRHRVAGLLPHREGLLARIVSLATGRPRSRRRKSSNAADRSRTVAGMAGAPAAGAWKRQWRHGGAVDPDGAQPLQTSA
jgi:glycerol-3-phosphate dehydrogenase